MHWQAWTQYNLTNIPSCIMRRVSSRQRLVSWDAFDATAGSDSGRDNEPSFAGGDDNFDAGHEIAHSQTFHSSADHEGLIESDAESCKNNRLNRTGTKLWTRRRKRDRKTLRDHCTERIISCKNVENPKASPCMTSTTMAVPSIIPSYSWETGKLVPSKISHFNELIDDIHIDILAFLDLSSLRAVMCVNHHYRKLISSEDARNSIWMYHCEYVWCIEREKDNRSPLMFVDNLRLPMAAASESTATFGSETAGNKSQTTNLSLLLSLAPTKFPTSVDKDLLNPRTRLSRTIQQTIPADRLEEELMLCYQDSLTGRSIVRYTGCVGQGDRCIRTDHPLPRPSRKTRCNKRSESKRPFLLNILRCSSKSMASDSTRGFKLSSSFSTSALSQPSCKWAPFVVPFVDQSTNSTTTTMNVTPRFVSYFEVGILKLEDINNGESILSSDTIRAAQGGPRSYRSSYSDCVAVGIATKSFQYQSRMPGWDQQSYGYHGDDGGIFHSSGGMLKQFGPKFGPGDTVGCGIDYVSKGIFYTLNGEFLGYAWEHISDDILQKDLFPVVGIDTNSPIHLNFGSVNSGPFQFDLSNFIKKHEKIISSIYSHYYYSCSDGTGVESDKANSEKSIETNGSSFSEMHSSRRQRRA